MAVVTHHKRGQHTLFQNGTYLQTFATEVELVQYANTIGIDFRTMDVCTISPWTGANVENIVGPTRHTIVHRWINRA